MASAWSENMMASDHHRKKAIEELGRGREMTNQLRDLLICSNNNNNNSNNKYNNYCKWLEDEENGKLAAAGCEDLVEEILNSFAKTLSILKNGSGGSSSSGSDYEYYDEVSNQKKKNNNNDSIGCLDGRKSEDSSGDSAKSTSTRKDRRGSYKRRKCEESRVEYTPTLIDDGHAWRKYGQKVILNAKHPRNYYRCTHKDQGCKAQKQVQKIEDNPPKYKTTYFGNHTCINLLKPAASQHINILDHDDHHPTLLISFANHNKHDHDQHDPFFFSSTTFPSISDSSLLVIKQEESKESDDLPISDISYNRPSPSSDYLVSPDHHDHLNTFESSMLLSADADGVVESVDFDDFLEFS